MRWLARRSALYEKVAASASVWGATCRRRMSVVGHAQVPSVGRPPPRPGRAPGLVSRDDAKVGDLRELLRKNAEEVRSMIDMPSSVREAREDLTRRVEKAIQSAYGRRYRVEVFGSVRYGVSFAHSDMDLVVFDPKRPYGSMHEWTKNHSSIYKVRHLGRVLSRAGFEIIEVVWRATVPLVKFRDKRTGLSCDINVNERLGVFNSELIRAYCELFPPLRPLLAVIKLWAKPLGLNEPSKRGSTVTFSSYAFALMTIGYLQLRGLVPNLQAGLPALKAGDKRGTFAIAQPAVRCDVRFVREMPHRQAAEVRLEDLAQGWFLYWAREHEFERQSVSVREGGMVPAVLDRYEFVRVQDPFIESKNVARSIGRRVVNKFRRQSDLMTSSC